MVEENPHLKNKMIDASANRKFGLDERKEKESFKKKKNAKWDKFELKHPKAAKAIQNIRNSKIIKNIGRTLKIAKAALITGGSVVVTGFLIGK